MQGRVVRTLPIWVAVVLLPLPTVARAQTPSSLTVGTRVRVWTGAGSDIGTFGGAEDTYIRLVTDSNHTRQIPTSEVLRIDRYAGKHRQTVIGMLLGSLGGALVGGVLYKPDANASDEFNQQSQAGAVLVGASGGMVVGGVIGFLSHTDSWDTVVPAPVAAVRREPDGTLLARLGVRLPLGRGGATARR